MIDVDIREDRGIVALCTITGNSEEFKEDLARIKSIPFEDRDFVSDIEPKYWRIRNAEKYADRMVEIGDAIRIYKAQLKLPGL